MEALGKLEQLHTTAFNEIHVNGHPLSSNDPEESENMQLEFLGRYGVSQNDFKKVYHSFAVETQMQRAEELTQRYRISGVPNFIVNGKYLLDVGTAGGHEQVTQLIDYLAALEHKH
jgi:thiol:disulfide interchange protein DsbA